MKYCAMLLALICATAMAYAQAPVNYNDVALIINDNDTNSTAIGAYFAAKRNVPIRNIIHIDAPAKETITTAEFAPIRAQIEAYLIQTGLRDSINYFVTTKGVPLRVSAADVWENASFDAEIMLILGSYATHIGLNSLFPTPTTVRVHAYFRRDEPYGRKNIVPFSNPPTTYDLYLTTRLIGLTKEDVFSLIDRSGPFTLVDKDSALFVFDRDPKPIQLDPYDNNLELAGNLMTSRGWNVLLNRDSIFVTNQRNVIGYGSWGSNDHYDHHYTQSARPLFTWTPGSLAETYVSTSARNFIPGQEAGQSRIADLIAEGCIGVSGYVFEPYTVALTWVNYLFDRYTRGYNLAESYYMANPTISWMAVVVGDPKTSIITSIPPVPTPAILPKLAACVGSSMTLQSSGTLPGLLHWFSGDTTAVRAQGPPFDATHPLWFASGTQAVITPTAEGPFTVSLLNENFVGAGWAQMSTLVVPELTVQLQVSADTLYFDEDPTLTCSAISPDASGFSWNFGDGGTATTAQASHRYMATGIYTVRCTVSNANCTKVAQQSIVVRATRQAVKALVEPLVFGIVQITKQRERNVEILNGFPSSVQLLTASIEGTHAGDFGIGLLTLPVSISSMGKIPIPVTFTPSAVGFREARLVLTFSGTAGTLYVTLQGEGTLDPVAVNDLAGTILEFDLLQSYPNPASGAAHIPFALSKSSHVRITVVDAAGRVVSTVTNERRAQGFHTETFDTRSLNPGVYFLVLETEGRKISRPFSVMR